MANEDISAAADEFEDLAARLEEMDTLADKLKMFHMLSQQYELYNAARLRMYHALDRLNKKVLPEAFEAEGVDKVRIPEVGRSFYPQEKTSASAVDKEAAKIWLREHNADHIISETINAGTLAAFLRSYTLENAIDPPEDIFRVSTYSTIGSSKYNPK